MYTFAQRLKLTAFVLMGLGVIGLTIGFLSTPDTVAEAQALVADAHGGHGEDHGDAHATDMHDAAHDVHESSHDAGHGDTHDDAHGEHLLHQLQNRPWAALYVAIFFDIHTPTKYV